MCRHAAAVGPGIALSELMLDLPHALVQQSYQARELLTGVVCADGFGVGWYAPEVRPEPARYANPMPIWSDAAFASIAPVVRSGMVIGSVRNATVAGQNTQANCLPLAEGRYLFSHNGFLGGFEEHWGESVLMEDVPLAKRTRVTSDSHMLFQALLARIPHEDGLGTAVQSVIRDAVRHADDVGAVAQLNLLVSDGERLVATRAGASPTQNSLYHLFDGEDFPGSHVIASEPLYDDPEWEVVPTDTVMVLQEGAPPVRLRA